MSAAEEDDTLEDTAEELSLLDQQQQVKRQQVEQFQQAGQQSEQQQQRTAAVSAEDDDDLNLPEFPTTKVVRMADCWLLLLGVCPLVGGGQLLNLNINQMCEARSQVSRARETNLSNAILSTQWTAAAEADTRRHRLKSYLFFLSVCLNLLRFARNLLKLNSKECTTGWARGRRQSR